MTVLTKEKAAGARTAKELLAVATWASRWHGIAIGGVVLRDRWQELTGKKSTTTAIRQMVDHAWMQPKNPFERSVTETEAELRMAMTNREELGMFRSLVATRVRISLCRFTDLKRFTGWHGSREDAWAVWAYRNPPTCLDTVMVFTDRHHLLAVKLVLGRKEIVLNRSAADRVEWQLNREVLK